MRCRRAGKPSSETYRSAYVEEVAGGRKPTDREFYTVDTYALA